MSEESDNLPYRAEYAKSGRAKCKGCKVEIPQGDCRLASLTQSAFFDGKQANWFHLTCFFSRNRPQAVGEFSHFEQLRWEDQEKIRERIANKTAGPLPDEKGGKGKGKGKGKVEVVDGTVIKDYRTEYAKSGASTCRSCEEKIPKGEVRIAKKDFDDEKAKRYGPMDRWHHAKCFGENRETLEFFAAADKLAGLTTLSKEDQIMVKGLLPKLKRKLEEATDEPDSKKLKLGVKDEPEDKEEMKKQNKKMFYYRDLLQKGLKKKDLEGLLEYNNQEIPVGQDRMLDRLCDIMTFGCLESCKECSGGQFVYQSGVGYRCQGDLTEWTKCQVISLNPSRRPLTVPHEYKEKFDFLAMYKGKTGTRLMANLPGGSVNRQSNGNAANGQGSSTAALLPLRNMSFVFSGKINKEKIQKKIEAFGGKVTNNVHRDTTALVSDPATLKEERSKVRDAKKHSILVVGQEFIAGIKAEGVNAMLKQHALSDWGVEEIQEKVSKAHSSGSEKSKKGSMFQSASMPKSVKLKLKGGGYVDPDSGLDDKAHVYAVKDKLYSVVLGNVNIQDGKNSFYKLQILKHDKKNKWYVFRAWGRVGTTIGGNKLQDFEDVTEAVRDFEFLYEEKTGNKWKNRNEFKKVPGKFYPLELDMGETQETKLSLENSKSTLPKPVKELVTLIFDIESMKRALVEFEIDLTKMPLGKLSKSQIQKAYGILTEVQNLLKTETGTSALYLDASNRFFTLIPHDFGMNSPPLLDNPDLVKTKIDMLDNLLEIEIAYNLLSSEEISQDKDPIDAHYEKLNTDLAILEKESDEFKILEEYVKNTHASTHTQYTLEIQEIFKVSRKGEAKRFKPFKALPNRTLLWHGSRTTNFAGILSQGLRIAPPEAPVTGYMFGKGIYFADMVSKSANYCCTNRTNNTGLLLLCDVALGKMYERTKADYIEKLPAGFHSTKGIGKTEPDPNVSKEIEGVKVPLGKGTKDATKKTDLLYSEYIVYDVSQVQSKYLLRTKFNYKL